jgi:hypothetical protein
MCIGKVLMSSDCGYLMFSAPQAKWKILDRVLFKKFFTKKFIGTDKIGETVSDSDSDEGSFSELSDSET